MKPDSCTRCKWQLDQLSRRERGVARILALIHAAVGELHVERLPAEQVESALLATVVGAVTGA
jgi:hypothetical protein